MSKNTENNNIINLDVCKERNKYTASDKFLTGCRALGGQSVQEISKDIGMSREYVYQQKKKIEEHAAILDEAEPHGKVIELTREFKEKAIIALALHTRSSEYGVQSFFEDIFEEKVSIGFISSVLDEAARRARKYDYSIKLDGIRQGANDEIFQGNTPILTGIDPESTYVYLLEEATDRKAETWEIYMEDRKSQGLNLEVTINDGGTGLLSGIPKAFPNVQIQRDTFHVIYEMRKEITKIEKKAYAAIRQEYKIEEKEDKIRYAGQRIKTAREARNAINLFDTLIILYNWLREMLGFSGYDTKTTSDMIHFILDKMNECAAEHPGILKETEKIRKNLSSLLSYTKRLEVKMQEAAQEKGIPPDAFRIMYEQRLYPSESEQYQVMDNQLVLMLMPRYEETRKIFQKFLNETKKASSLVENVNGRIRTYIDLKRIVPTNFFVLMKVYFNTHRYKRSRIKERIGKSPLELLTGKSQPNFFEAIGY